MNDRFANQNKEKVHVRAWWINRSTFVWFLLSLLSNRPLQNSSGIYPIDFCNLPVVLTEDWIAVSEEPLEIFGQLYVPNLSRTKSQALAAGHLRKKVPTRHELSFVAYEILGSTAN